MKNSQKILIVGGVAGGASAAARLRRLDENAEIIMLERGEYISFANCGLPYYIGGEITEKSALTLQTPASFHARFRVDVRNFSEVTAIDTEAKNVTVKNSKTGEVYTEGYDKLILSMGAEPIKPNLGGADSGRVFTLRNIPDTYRIKDFIDQSKPKRAVVVGGGYIGVEMAENLHRAGLEVTIVEMSDQVIAPLDYDMACDVHRHIQSKGVKLLLGNAVRSIAESGNSLNVVLDSGEITADMLIMAIGVRPESAIAKNAGLALNERGFIVVNENMQTSDPQVYAVGDTVEVTDFVTGQKAAIPLAGPANKQGRIAADNICGISSKYTGTQGSSILKVFDMTVATTGVNEKTAKRLGLHYDKSFTYSASHASYYPGAVNMTIKIIFEQGTGKLLGAQVVGYDGVDKRCDVLATAIRAGMTAYDLTRLELCYAPPYSSAKDPVNMAGYVIENLLTGKVKNFHWHDVKDLPRDGSVTLLDTRTAIEFENGSIDGFINIPLDSLRDRLGELDKSKPVYVTCQVALRGYIAARILMQNGFECYNLSGGYRLYHSIFGAQAAPKNPVVLNPETQRAEKKSTALKIDACGLQCPGPIVKLSEALKQTEVGDVIEISTTDPAFAADIQGYCRRTGNVFRGMNSSKGVSTVLVEKAESMQNACNISNKDNKNLIVFSGDLDKAIASFIIANAAAAMGRKVSMFFTFWGLNILRRPKKVSVKKDFISKMFGGMMPRGSKKLGLSNMNMGGMGAKMIRGVMKNKNVDSLEDLIRLAQSNGVELVACSMSMDVMGLKPEELIDGVKLGGAAAMLANAEESDMSLFI
ncbi:DsrE/DsrF/DrsH-like family protein [Hydrogenoanaerobacterium sp.]|uniref:DsrE/DsrF/DrsH-like family protein n=1 Tax=Hydrogenoanaerobacterium sp. TaxID=2953763 RepID=UPI00289A7B3B|nr:DsrE/DsrF/DrsH-like family protein [Hydrogenoanaerobacterium sp.]